MREIKFRIYDKGRNEWVHGPGDEVSLFGECILCGELLRRDSDDTHVRLQDLNDIVALQFTGLKDKNGVEIFEGDVIKHSPERRGFGVIEYDSARFGINWDYGTDNKQMLGAWGSQDNIRGLEDGFYKKIEVIGSIYSNPELLKK